MNKILVEVYIPIAQKSFDMFIPLHLPLFEVVRLISRIAADMTNGLFLANEETTLCSREGGSILNWNLSVSESGLKNGTKLMLV